MNSGSRRGRNWVRFVFLPVGDWVRFAFFGWAEGAPTVPGVKCVGGPPAACDYFLDGHGF